MGKPRHPSRKDRVHSRYSDSSGSIGRGVSQIVGVLLMIAFVVAAVAGYYVFYKGFFKDSSKDVNMDMAHITLNGPTTGSANEVVVLHVKNSGNVDFASWSFVEGSTDSGTDFSAGDQATSSVTLGGTGPWVFKVQAVTNSGKVAEDSWIVENP